VDPVEVLVTKVTLEPQDQQEPLVSLGTLDLLVHGGSLGRRVTSERLGHQVCKDHQDLLVSLEI